MMAGASHTAAVAPTADALQPSASSHPKTVEGTPPCQPSHPRLVALRGVVCTLELMAGPSGKRCLEPLRVVRLDTPSFG